MNHLKQDVRYSLRRLYKTPAFTVIAVITLALGIGANSAIFSVVNAVLLKPLPYPESNRLVGVYHVSEGHRTTMSGPNFVDAALHANSLENAAATHRARVVLTGEGEPVALEAAEVSASLFNVLRVNPILGRGFNADEDTPGKTNVIVLSYGLWRQRFGAAKDVIGKRVTIDGVPREVVGVMPAGFSYPPGRDAWLPIEYGENFVTKQRGAWQYDVVARLKPGVTPEQSAAEVDAIGRNLARRYPDANANLGITTLPLHEAVVGDIRRSMLVLFGAVAFVLLIACANVANLLLARAASRESEMAVRTALGAGRGRLIRQLLTECVILAIFGGGLGLLIAVWGVSFLTALQPAGLPRLDAVAVDAPVVVFTLSLAVLTGIVFGVFPAVHATQSPVWALKETGRGAVTSNAGARMRGALIVAELALAVMLLVGAGLLMRSFVRLQSVDPGFRPDHALTFNLTLPDARYGEDAPRVAFFDQLLPKLAALPGAQAVGAVMGVPLIGMQFNISFKVEGRPPVAPADEPSMEIRVASPEYFSTIGIPVKRGRAFSDEDRIGAPQVVVITESAAKRFFPNEDPIGKTITLGWGKRDRNGVRTAAGGRIVGIVGDIKDAGLNEPYSPELYMPLRQWPIGWMSVILKTTMPPESLAKAAQAAVSSIDPDLPVSNVSTLDRIVARSISQPRFYMLLLTLFAALALTLAAIGIFGVLSYAVSQRTREIGIRMALGAQERSVIGLVVRQAMVLVAAGLAAGTIAAVFVAQTMTKMLFNVEPTDPATFAAVGVVLAAVALLASYLPARRATRVDPIVALRTE
jgi:putative ABC transport system permease protein